MACFDPLAEELAIYVKCVEELKAQADGSKKFADFPEIWALIIRICLLFGGGTLFEGGKALLLELKEAKMIQYQFYIIVIHLEIKI